MADLNVHSSKRKHPSQRSRRNKRKHEKSILSEKNNNNVANQAQSNGSKTENVHPDKSNKIGSHPGKFAATTNGNPQPIVQNKIGSRQENSTITTNDNLHPRDQKKTEPRQEKSVVQDKIDRGRKRRQLKRQRKSAQELTRPTKLEDEVERTTDEKIEPAKKKSKRQRSRKVPKEKEEEKQDRPSPQSPTIGDFPPVIQSQVGNMNLFKKGEVLSPGSAEPLARSSTENSPDSDQNDFVIARLKKEKQLKLRLVEIPSSVTSDTSSEFSSPVPDDSLGIFSHLNEQDDQDMADALRSDSPEGSQTSTIDLNRDSPCLEIEDARRSSEITAAEDQGPREFIDSSGSGRHILLKTPMGARIFTKVDDPNKFVIYANPDGPQIYEQAMMTGVAIDDFEQIPQVDAAPDQLPPEAVFNADKVAFPKYPQEIQRLLEVGAPAHETTVKGLKKFLDCRSNLENGRRRAWKRYLIAKKALDRISGVRACYRHQYDDDFESFRLKVQKKIRRDVVGKMKELLATSAGVDRLDAIIRENLKAEWPLYSNEL